MLSLKINSSFTRSMLIINTTLDITHLKTKKLILFQEKRNIMSITHIKTQKKVEVLVRLLENKETLVDACSKAGLNKESFSLENKDINLENLNN